MDGDSSEDDCNFTTVTYSKHRIRVAHLVHKECEGCAFLRFRRFRP